MTNYELSTCAPFILLTYIRKDGRVATRATKFIGSEILVVDEGFLLPINTVKKLTNELYKRGWVMNKSTHRMEEPPITK